MKHKRKNNINKPAKAKKAPANSALIISSDIRIEILNFLDFAKQKSGLSFSAISNLAEISPSTITRFIKDASMQEISLGTLNKIATACGIGSYKKYISDAQTTEAIEISDEIKFETYDAVKRILKSKKLNHRQAELAEITNNVLEHAKTLGTDFITDSLITYVIERLER
jgi:transcriptional regulator with XRE-family HTH domain